MAKKPQEQQVEAEHPNQAEQKMPAERQGGERTRSAEPLGLGWIFVRRTLG